MATLHDAIAAVQTELGINPAGNYTDVVDRLNDYDTIGWTAAQLGYLGWNYDVQYIQSVLRIVRLGSG